MLMAKFLASAALALTLAQATPAAAAQNTFADPLDTPALMTAGALASPVFAIARIDGDRLAGVGPRGLILISSDAGRTWRQVASPVSTDLLAVNFSTPQSGWIAGHNGILLHSSDGGASWKKMLDGRDLGPMMAAFYTKLQANGDSPEIAAALDEARAITDEVPSRPFLDVWFRNAEEGWAVGQFNLILHTSDGGATWEPWMERTGNPERLSLHAIRGAGDDVYIAGELGLVLKLSPDGSRFDSVQTPYPGSYFGLLGSASEVVVFGLRGNTWRSRDQGATWSQLPTGVTSAINAGIRLSDGRILLVAQGGQVLMSHATGDGLTVARPEEIGAGFGLLQLSEQEALVATRQGIKQLTLPPAKE
ncbi:MAG: glycosyl hydrolase [Azonexus sp.]|jgi:photosystem II stability/assembly factor-like uncharacterized protein|nr:glycosyl hydrolase [Azonexus sp.]